MSVSSFRTALRSSPLPTDAGIAGSAGLALIAFDSPLGGARLVLALAAIGVLAISFAVLRPERDVALCRDLTAATIGISIALGYAGSHLIEGGAGASVIGFASAAAWLAVLVAALTRILRRGSWIVRLTTVVVALIVLQFVALPLAVGTGGVHAPRQSLSSERPIRASEVTVSVTAGVELGAWYTPGTNGAALVVLPGSDGNRGQTVAHAAALNESGYATLAVDARGSGNSTGYGNVWGWNGYEDIAAAINWLDEQPGIDPMRIGVVGLSMGAEQALTAAPLDHRIKAVVAEGVQGRVASDTWYLGDDLRSMIERTVDALTWAVADIWSETPAPVPLRDVADGITRQPVFLIAADASDERVVAADLASRSALIDVWQTTGVGHTQALALAPAEWRSRVSAFLDEALLGDQARVPSRE